MNLNELKKNWDQFGIDDPYWAILTHPDMKGNKWDEKEFFETGQKVINNEVRRIKRVQPDFTFQSALDFGCGAGRLTQALADHFDNAIGVDIASSMINLANEKNKKQNCRYYLNEKNDLSLFGNDEFDFIISIITLQHMQPKYAKNYISEFFRILKPNGMLKFQIPSKPDAERRKHLSPLEKFKRSILGLFNSSKENTGDPIMEMYWIPIDEMVTFLTAKGAKIERIKKNNAAGELWDSYTYVATKPLKYS